MPIGNSCQGNSLAITRVYSMNDLEQRWTTTNKDQAQFSAGRLTRASEFRRKWGGIDEAILVPNWACPRTGAAREERTTPTQCAALRATVHRGFI